VIAPLILLFSVIVFGALWILYRSHPPKLSDSVLCGRGQFYPTAIRQLFTGLYCMELCLGGLFYLVRDGNDEPVCAAQAIAMIFLVFFTLVFQCTMGYWDGLSWRPTSIMGKIVGYHKQEKVESKQVNRFDTARTVCFSKCGNAGSISRCIIWVPKDALGIAANESYHSRRYNKRLVLSTKGAVLNKDGRIVLSGGPLQ
jgi:hypothetical protein